jgi:hypothetical protein
MDIGQQVASCGGVLGLEKVVGTLCRQVVE